MSFDIIGTGSALPENRVDNEALSKFLDTSDEWISSRTGIKERRLLKGESLTGLAAQAGLAAMAMANVKAEELDLILCATISADRIVPSLSCQVQAAIGASCPAFDINAACSGFLYALDAASAYLNRRPGMKILVIAADAMSRLVDWRDRGTCVLFGDGAGAALLTGGGSLKALRLSAKGDAELMAIPGLRGNSPFGGAEAKESYLAMQGQEVYRFAVSAIVSDMEWLVNEAGIRAEDIDMVLLHQANARILGAAAARTHIPDERFVSNIQSRGNTSAASIPILLDELMREGKIKPGMTLALCAFGGGLTTGACLIRWPGGA